jgi:hypothetical protein
MPAWVVRIKYFITHFAPFLLPKNTKEISGMKGDVYWNGIVLKSCIIIYN